MDLLLIEFHEAGIILPDEKLDEETRRAWIVRRRQLEYQGVYCSSWVSEGWVIGIPSDEPYFCQLPRDHKKDICLYGPRDLSILNE